MSLNCRNEDDLQNAIQLKFNELVPNHLLMDITNDCNSELDIDIKEEPIEDNKSNVKEDLFEPVGELEDNNLDLNEEPSQHVEYIGSCKLSSSKKEYKCDICNYKCYYLHEPLHWVIKRHRDLVNQCKNCNFHCMAAYEFKKHESSCVFVTILKCTYCFQQFDVKSEFLKHVQKHRDKIDHKCGICNDYYLNYDALKNHMIQDHQGLFKCTMCVFQSVFKDDFEIHMQYHASNVSKTTNKQVSKQTKKRVRSPIEYICEKCGKHFRQKSAFNKHLHYIQNQKGLFKCIICNYKSIFKDEVEEHTKSHDNDIHQSLSKELSNSTKQKSPDLSHTQVNEKQYICEQCGRIFHHGGSFNKHKYTHTGEKPYKCKLCTKQFSSFHSRAKHILNHSGSKPFCCNVCDYKCVCSSRLRCHMRIHTGEKPFQCLICSFKCSYKVSLKNHMQVHTGKQFCCELCDYECSDKVTLNRHIKSHHK